MIEPTRTFCCIKFVRIF